MTPTLTHPASTVLSHWLTKATLFLSAVAGTTVKKLFCCCEERPLGIMLGHTVMKAVFPLLVTDLILRVNDLSWAKALTQSLPLKLKPVEHEEHIEADIQEAHFSAHLWHWLLVSLNIPLPQVLLADTHIFWLRVRPEVQAVQ